MRRKYHNVLLHKKQIRLQRIFTAAQLLQACWRGFVVRRCYAPVLEARRVTRLQKEALLRNVSAAKIQARWRGYWARHVYGPTLAALKEKRISESLIREEEMQKKSVLTATTLQALWRGYLVRKIYQPMLKKRMEEQKKERDIQWYNAASSLQAHWKGYQVRQRVRRLLEERKKLKKLQENAAVVLQAFWRGHCCRVKYLRNKQEIERIRNVIQPTSEDLNVSSSCESSNMLTIQRRLQSSVKVKLQHSVPIADSSLNDIEGSTGAHMCSVQDGKMLQSSNEVLCGDHGLGVVEVVNLSEEKKALMSLTTSRHQEETIADQSRLRMSHAMTRWDAEKVGLSQQSKMCVIFFHVVLVDRNMVQIK